MISLQHLTSIILLWNNWKLENFGKIQTFLGLKRQKIVRMHKTFLTSQFLRLSLARFSREMAYLPVMKIRAHGSKALQIINSRGVSTKLNKYIVFTQSRSQSPRSSAGGIVGLWENAEENQPFIGCLIISLTHSLLIEICAILIIQKA